MTSPTTGAKILVAEDNPMLSELLAFQLARAGYQVTCAGDGVETLTLISEIRPALLLLDLGLPKIDGYQVMSELLLSRPASEAPNPPIIVLTGHGSANTRARAIALGAADFLIKPFGGEALLQIVERWIVRA